MRRDEPSQQQTNAAEELLHTNIADTRRIFILPGGERDQLAVPVLLGHIADLDDNILVL